MLTPWKAPCCGAFALLLFLLLGLLTPLLTRDVPYLLDDLVAGPLLHDASGALSSGQCRDVALGLKPEVRFNDHWRPFGWFSLILDEVVLGPGVQAHRWVAGLLHGCIAWLVMSIVSRMLGSAGRWPAILAGSAILIAPWSVEPVVWVAHRFTLLNAVFLLAAMLNAIVWVQRGAHGFPLFTSLCTLAAALSKDSALTEAFALLPACWFFAPLGRRKSICARLLLATALPILAMLAARWAATGVWLPRYGDGAESFPLHSVLQQLPKTLEMFLLPFASHGATSRLFLLGGVAVLLAWALFLWRERATLSSERAAMVCWCVFLLVAGLPALMVDEWLDGARKFLLPGAVLLITMATLLPRRASLILAGTILVFAGGWVERLDAYHAAALSIREATTVVTELPGDAPVLVTSFDPLPATQRGVPLFGAGATHFPLYFHPANGPRHEVRLCTPIEVSREISRRSTTAHLVALRRRAAGSPGFDAEAFLIPAPNAERRGLDVLQPQSGRLFPVRGGVPEPDTRIAFRVEGERLPDWILLEVQIPEGKGAFVIRLPELRGLESSLDGETMLVRVPATSLEGIFPVEGQDRLAALFTAPGSVAAALRLSVLARPGATAAPLGTWTSFMLGAGP